MLLKISSEVRCGFKSCDNEAIKSALRHGDSEVVKLLIEDKRVESSVDYNRLLIIAMRDGQYSDTSEIVQLLF
jgi:hypothetical protein